MSDDTTTKSVAKFDAPRRLSREEKARLDGLSDKDIARAAQSDPDNPVLTAADLEEFKPVADAKQIRHSLKLTQEAFARAFHIPIGTLRDWEQHRRSPDAPARTLLGMVDADPKAALDLIERSE